MIKWTRISNDPTQWRFQALSEELKLSGVENLFEPTLADEANFGSAVESAKDRFSQIRVGGEFAEHALRYYPDLPADMLNLRAIDSFVPEAGKWWPRCFYFDGFIRLLVRDLRDLDLAASVFIMGATWQARVIVAALTRAGFNKVSLSDIDDTRGQAMVDELRRLNFGSVFQYVPRSMITQLPGTSSIGINVLSLVEFPDIVSDLSYLNFLRPDGIWLETHASKEDSPITTEAISLGTQVEPALHLISNVDEAWADRCFKVKIDLQRYRNSLNQSLKKHS